MSDQAGQPRDRRASDRWSPPIHSIRSVRQIVVVDVVFLAVLVGSLVVVLPGTVTALYGATDALTPVHVGPGLLLVIAIVIAIGSIAAGTISIASGYPRIVRGHSAPSGRFSRRSMHAMLLAGALAIVQLAVFAWVLPPQL